MLRSKEKYSLLWGADMKMLALSCWMRTLLLSAGEGEICQTVGGLVSLEVLQRLLSKWTSTKKIYPWSYEMKIWYPASEVLLDR